MCLTVLLTAGRSAAGRQQLLSRVEQAGSLVLTVTDRNDIGLITPTSVGVVGGLSTVARAVGVGIGYDSVNAAVGIGGPPVATWAISGDINAVVRQTSGRAPLAGEALVSESALATLGFDAGAGAVVRRSSLLTNSGAPVAIVGTYVARDPFEDLAHGVIVAAGPAEPLHTLRVVATSAGTVGTTQSAVLGVLSPPRLDSVVLTSPTALAELQQQLGTDLRSETFVSLILTVGLGAVLVAGVVLADVLMHTADLGRRRALGARRKHLVAIVITRTGYAGLAGALLGSAAGLVTTGYLGYLPPFSLGLGTAVLAIATALTAAAVPAAVSAFRDPVTVLRGG